MNTDETRTGEGPSAVRSTPEPLRAYIGDGVYASTWGAGGIVLTTGGFKDEPILGVPRNTIYFEMEVLDGLAMFLAQARREGRIP